MTLDGKIALVTGGGSGLGKASALKLASEGATIALLSIDKGEVDAVAAQIADKGGKVLPLYADISKTADMQSAFDKIKDAFGRLDIVFANAGINGTWAPIDELSVEDWDKTIAVNLRGTFLTIHHAVPLMKEHGGSIIITSSINGTRTFTTAGASAYSTTKAGQLALAQMTALELAKHRIRVNAICPGAIKTKIDSKTERQNVQKAAEPAYYPDGQIPLTDGKPGKPEDVADLVCFLASDASRLITGTPVWIDGAQSLLV